MPTWDTTFLVEPLPGTGWDRRDLAAWQGAAPHHTFANIVDRRSVRVTARFAADETQTAVAEGRAAVDAFFPPSRYWVQNPRFTPSAAGRRLLREGAALYLAHTARGAYRDRPAARQ